MKKLKLDTIKGRYTYKMQEKRVTKSFSIICIKIGCAGEKTKISCDNLR